MSLTAKDEGSGNFTPAPEGTHSAVCFAVIDLGTQYSDRWKKSQHKVLIGWELDCDEKRDDGEPFVLWRRYTVSLHEKASLRQTLEAWRGRKFTDEELGGFDLRNILSVPCLLTVTHAEVNGNTYSNVAAVSALPRRMPVPASTKGPVLFDIDNPDMAVFSTFGERLQEQIKAAEEWKGQGGMGPGPDDEPPPHDDDDIPF